MKPAGRRLKGDRVEREIVKLHQAIGVKAERVPLSGAAQFQGNGEDVDVYPYCSPVLHCQVKAVGPGTGGFKTVHAAIGAADVLFIRYDAEPGRHAPPPLVVMPWATWERLLKYDREVLRRNERRGKD